MTGRFAPTLLMTLTLTAGLTLPQPAPASAQVDMSCIANERMPLDGRRSPLDSLTFQVAGHESKICYGRPSSRGRTMIGGSNVPFGKVWRTGANEVTLLRTPIDLSVAGIHVPAGTYSFYTVPGEKEWEIIVNRSYSQWGNERTYTEEVQKQEVGRGTVSIEQIDESIETFTISSEESEGEIYLILEWERTRVRVPVSAAEG